MKNFKDDLPTDLPALPLNLAAFGRKRASSDAIRQQAVKAAAIVLRAELAAQEQELTQERTLNATIQAAQQQELKMERRKSAILQAKLDSAESMLTRSTMSESEKDSKHVNCVPLNEVERLYLEKDSPKAGSSNEAEAQEVFGCVGCSGWALGRNLSPESPS